MFLGGGNQRSPKVCVSVEDTQLSTHNDCSTYMGVRNVKVIFKSIYAPIIIEKYTNHDGAVYFNNKLYGHWRMYVEFINPFCSVLGLEEFSASNMLNFVKPVKDYVGTFNNSFNDISVCYDNSTDNQSQAFRYWRAATINNSVFEYLIWCSRESVTQPPKDLVIVGTNLDNSGAAPMLDKIFDTGSPTFGAVSNILGILYEVTWIVENLVRKFSPDIVMNTLTAEGRSDAIKQVMYHELSHASHFQELGYPGDAEPYWIAVINYIVLNLGYGNGTANDAGRIAVVENWAWTVGNVVADEAYGESHSNDTWNIERNRWLYLREANMFVNGFIQSGLCLDLIDTNLPNDLYEHPNIGHNDNMRAWTPKPYQAILNEMQSNVITVEQFRDNLRANIPASYHADYDLLMSKYGL